MKAGCGCHDRSTHTHSNPFLKTLQETPDIIAVGFQELVELNVGNALNDNFSKERSHMWIEHISKTINKQHKYVLLGSKYLVGIMLCVFVLDKHHPRVKEVQACTAATGVMGVVGNKGACSLRLEMYDTSFCFTVSHLAAHRENIEGRNSDFETINAKTKFVIEEKSESK